MPRKTAPPPQEPVSDEESLEQAFTEGGEGEPVAPAATETGEETSGLTGGTAAADSSQAAQQLATPPSLRERLSSRGYDTSSFENEDAAFDALLTTVEQYHQAQPYISFGQRYAADQADYERWRSERNQQKPTEQKPVVPEHESPSEFDWKPPEFNPDYLRFVEQDPRTGRYKPIEPSLQRYADAANQYADWERDTGRKILTDFPKVVEQAVAGRLAAREKALTEAFERKLEERFRDQESRSYAQEFVSRREKDFYARDAAGQYIRDPQTGNVVLTPVGQASYDYTMEVRHLLGIPDEAQPTPEQQRHIIAFVEKHLASDEKLGRFPQSGAPAKPNGNGQSAAEIGEGKRKQFMSRVLRSQRSVARTGSVPAPGSAEQQNADATIDEIFDEVAEAAGVKPRG